MAQQVQSRRVRPEVSPPFQHTFYIRPLTDHANELIARILQDQTEDVETFKCSMYLPGYTQKQQVYRVDARLMEDISNINVIKSGFKAYIQLRLDGPLSRWRTCAQVREAARLQALRGIRRQTAKRGR
jgi:hypothetical protein